LYLLKNRGRAYRWINHWEGGEEADGGVSDREPGLGANKYIYKKKMN